MAREFVTKASTIRRRIFARSMEIANRPDKVDVLSRMEKAIASYKPELYPGPVTLFVSSERVEESAGKSDFGWSTVTGGDLDVRVVPGDHSTIFHDLNVPILAKELRDLLAARVPHEPPKVDLSVLEESVVGQPSVRAVIQQLDEWLAQKGKCDTPAVRSLRRLLSKTLAKADPAHVLAVADALVKRGDWADRLVAYETVAAHRPAFAALDETRLIRWSVGLSSWGTVDLFGCTLGGQSWREGILSDAIVESWSRSTDRWRRRLALVCTVPLNSRARGGAGDATRTLRICEALVDDRDDMVVKALSWSLRTWEEGCKGSSPLPVAQPRSSGASGHAEVTNKLTSGKKTPGRGPTQPETERNLIPPKRVH